MSEVSTVAGLIYRLIAFAIGIGCLGTMYDLTKNSQEDAKQAFTQNQISYSKWNKRLLDRK